MDGLSAKIFEKSNINDKNIKFDSGHTVIKKQDKNL